MKIFLLSFAFFYTIIITSTIIIITHLYRENRHTGVTWFQYTNVCHSAEAFFRWVMTWSKERTHARTHAHNRWDQNANHKADSCPFKCKVSCVTSQTGLFVVFLVVSVKITPFSENWTSEQTLFAHQHSPWPRSIKENKAVLWWYIRNTVIGLN